MAVEQLSPTKGRHYATLGDGGWGVSVNLTDCLIRKKRKCWRHNSKSNVLGCGRTAAVVLQILVLLLQEESDFTAAQDTYYLRVKES